MRLNIQSSDTTFHAGDMDVLAPDTLEQLVRALLPRVREELARDGRQALDRRLDAGRLVHEGE
jgi:hypothetical protein